MGYRYGQDVRIRPNDRIRIPRRILFFDVETTLTPIDSMTFRHDYRLCCWEYYELDDTAQITCHETGHAWDMSEWHAALTRYAASRETLHLISANIGYDIAVSGILDWINKWRLKIQFMYLNGMAVILRAASRTHKITFLNLQNWYRYNVQRLGDYVGLPKLSTDTQTDDDAALLTYCQRDVEIIARAYLEYIRFVLRHNLGSVGMTIAKQAELAYRHKYMVHNIYAHGRPEVIALERDGYYGGMVRVYRAGTYSDRVYYKLDVNSMYPHVMRSHTYPTKLIGYYTDVSVDYLISRLRSCCVMADITYTPGLPHYPVRHGDHIIYPLYTTRAVRTTREIQEILQHGQIHHVHRLAVYRAQRIFTTYVDDLYRLKADYTAQHDSVGRQLVKDLLNSLYGVWGRRGRQFVRAPQYDSCNPRIDYEVDRVRNTRSKIYYLGDMAFREIVGGELPTSMVAIAAHITADARLQLCHYVDLVPEGHKYMSDTDSLIVDDVGYHILSPYISETELGFLKTEGTADYVSIHARKDYVFGRAVKLKGVPRSAQQLDDHTYTYTQWHSLRAVMSAHYPGYYTTSDIVKTLHRTIYDGIIQDDGVVVPYTSPPA